MKLLHELGDEAAGPGGVSRASFVAGALLEISIGLIRGNFFCYRASASVLARSSGASFWPGLAVLTDACVEYPSNCGSLLWQLLWQFDVHVVSCPVP
jgi:hypothetical protein